MNTKVGLVVAAFCLFQGVIALPNFVDVVLEYKTSINELQQNVDKLAEEKLSNIVLATQELNGLASEAQLHVEHQLKSLQSSTKKFDSCAAVKNAAMNEINTINVDSCKESAKWELVSNQIAALKQIKSTITNLPGTCMGVTEATAEKVRACIEEGLATLEDKLSEKDKEISGATTQQKLLASICINMVKAKVSTLVKDTVAEFETCNQKEESYLDVVAEYQPKIEEVYKKFDHDILVLRSNIDLAIFDVNQIVSKSDLFLEQQLSTVLSSSSSNKNIDDCIANKNEAVANLENFEFCKSVVDWHSVDDDYTYIRQLKKNVNEIIDVCVSKSKVNLTFLRSCIEESMAQTKNNFESFKDNINNAIISQTFVVSLCVTSTKTRIATQMEYINAEYSLCIDESEDLEYNDIIALAEKEINLIKSNIAAIETETENNLKMAVSLIEFSFQTSNAHVNKQLAQLEEAVKASDEQICIESQQIALEKVPINAINLCKAVPTLNLNKVQSKLEQIKDFETTMSTVVRSCLGTDQSHGLGLVNVDITLGSLNNCIKSSIKEVSGKVNTISGEILEIIKESTEAANDCATRNKNTIVSSLTEILKEFNSCNKNNKAETYLDVIAEYQPQIEVLNEQLVDAINVLKSNVALAAIDMNNIISETSLFLEHQLSSVVSVTETSLSSDKKLDACLVNQKQSIEVAKNLNFDSCKSAVNWDSVNADLKILHQLQSQAKQISEVCESRSTVNLPLLRNCIEKGVTQVKNTFEKVKESINNSIIGQKFVVSMCITSTKIRITTQFEDIIAEYSICVDKSEALEYNDIITTAEQEINLVKFNIAAIQGETSNNLNMALSVIEFTFQASNAHVNKELAQLEKVVEASDDQKCMESQQIALEKVPINAINMCKAVPTLNLNKVQSKLEEIKETETELSTVVRSCLGADQTHGLGLVKVEITLGSLNNCIQSSIKEVSGKVNTISSEILEIIKESTQAAKDCATRNKNTIISSLKEISEEFNTCTKNEDSNISELREEVTLLKQKVVAVVNAKSSSVSAATNICNQELMEAVSSIKGHLTSFISLTGVSASSNKKIDDCLTNHNEALEKAKNFNLGQCISVANWKSAVDQINKLRGVESEVDTMEKVCDFSAKQDVALLTTCLQNGIAAYKKRLASLTEEIDIAISTEKRDALTCISSTKSDITFHISDATAEFNMCVDESETIENDEAVDEVTKQTLEEVFAELTPKVDETAETVTNILIEASKTVTEIHSNVNKIVSSGAAKINQLSSVTKAQSTKSAPVIGCIKQQEVAFNKLDTKTLQLCRNQDAQLETLGQNLGEIANVQAKVGLSLGLCAKQYNLKADEVKSCIESYLSNSISFANNYFENIKSQIGRSTLITNICISNQSGELTRVLNEIAANYKTCVASK